MDTPTPVSTPEAVPVPALVGAADELQFDTAGPAAGFKACTACKAPIHDAYHVANGQVICSPCRVKLAGGSGDSGFVRFLRAFAYGAGMGLAGMVVYALVLKLTGYNLALITILIGYVVGRAVTVGSRNAGGWFFRLMAVGITYLSISVAWVPLLVDQMRESGTELPVVVQYIAAFITSIPLPFLMIPESPIGALIIAFGLFQAWKQTGVRVDVAGPFHVGRPQPQAAPAVE